jgi:hypothetical protein
LALDILRDASLVGGVVAAVWRFAEGVGRRASGVVADTAFEPRKSPDRHPIDQHVCWENGEGSGSLFPSTSDGKVQKEEKRMILRPRFARRDDLTARVLLVNHIIDEPAERVGRPHRQSIHVGRQKRRNLCARCRPESRAITRNRARGYGGMACWPYMG